MNGSLRGSALEGSQVYLGGGPAAPLLLRFFLLPCFCFHVFLLLCFSGLSPRDLILHFRHKVEETGEIRLSVGCC